MSRRDSASAVVAPRLAALHARRGRAARGHVAERGRRASRAAGGRRTRRGRALRRAARGRAASARRAAAVGRRPALRRILPRPVPRRGRVRDDARSVPVAVRRARVPAERDEGVATAIVAVEPEAVQACLIAEDVLEPVPREEGAEVAALELLVGPRQLLAAVAAPEVELVAVLLVELRHFNARDV